MKTATGKPFSKLSRDAKARALEHGRDAIRETFDTADLTENLQGYVKETWGLVTEKCYWSLGHCQGDGVAFYGTLDLEPLQAVCPDVLAVFARLRLLGVHADFSVHIGGSNSHYHHWNSMSPNVNVTYYDSNDEICDQAAADLENFLADYLKDVSRDAERYGYEWIDEQESDESVQEFLETNDYRFDREGEVVD